jgi:SET domain-containing protein
LQSNILYNLSMEKKTYSWMDERLAVKDTPKYGKGVFASEPIEKNSPLMVFGGYVLTRKEEVKLPLEIRDIAIQIDKDLVIGVLTKKEVTNTDYVNHSCDPNSGIKGQISLVAMRNIKEGEEITFDYGTVLYREKGAPKYELKCLCGSKNCRGKITQYDWQIPSLQEKYKDFFPYYIKEEIAKLKK